MEEKLKEKIVQTRKEISEFRGIIITHCIDIEKFIGAIITNYFILSNRQIEFRQMVLSDPYFSFGLKINIFNKLLNKLNLNLYKEFKNDLQRINKIRNIFAHTGQFGFDGQLSYPAGENPLKFKKAREMYEEFFSLYPKVWEELDKIFLFLVEELKKRKNSVKE